MVAITGHFEGQVIVPDEPIDTVNAPMQTMTNQLTQTINVKLDSVN